MALYVIKVKQASECSHPHKNDQHIREEGISLYKLRSNISLEC